MSQQYLPLRIAKAYEEDSPLVAFIHTLENYIAELYGEEVSSTTREALEKFSLCENAFSDKYKGPFQKVNDTIISICPMEWDTNTIRDNFRAAWIIDKWSKCKQVYELDNDFAHALAITENIKVYTDILKHLPFNCFYID